jgi:hypothetical protein
MAMTPAEARAAVDRLCAHAGQVLAGVIPPDSPPTFTVPQPVDERGLPWWFGPEYQPTPEAIESFSKPESS